LFEGDLTHEERGLARDLTTDTEAGAGDLEWKHEIFEGRHHIIACIGDVEVGSLQVHETIAVDIADEHLVLCEDLESYFQARYTDVLSLRPTKRTLLPSQQEWQKPGGRAETEREFFVRVLLHGEDIESDEFWEQTYPRKSTEYAPGEYIAMAARSALIEEESWTARKVLTRRRYKPKPGAVQASRSVLERFGLLDSAEFKEAQDTDSWFENLRYRHDDMSSGRTRRQLEQERRELRRAERASEQGEELPFKPAPSDPTDWIRYPDLLRTWLDW
jgi:hypothetical protein